MLRKLSVALVAVAAIIGLSATAANAAAPVKPTPAAGFTAITPHLIGGGGRVTPNAFGGCTNGHGCAYVNVNGGGAVYDMVFSVVGTSCHNMPAGFVATVSSTEIKFGSGYGVLWYDAVNCDTGADGLVQPHLTDANMTDFYRVYPIQSWNDAIRSFQLVIA